MTADAGAVATPRASGERGTAARAGASGSLLEWLTTTDHKRIGLLYAAGSFGFMLLAGVMALAMRAELSRSGLQFMNEETYNQLFTMHGTLMMLLFGTPLAAAFANFLVPLQIGAADMAFPRLNALSFWLFLFGGFVVLSGFATVGGAASAGWTGYPPLSDRVYSPSVGMDLWIAGLVLIGISSILGAVNFITTIYARRARGMTMLRMPMLTWAILVTSIMMLFAFPPLTAALAMLFIDRHAGGAFFDPTRGGDAVLWQHLFWFFGHPEVYILILPTFGIVSEIIPVFSRKPIFGYRSMVFAFLFIAGYSMSVWAHHMFTTGAVSNPFFSIISFLIAVPTGIKFFNWIATMWRGQLRFATPMLWAVGMLYVFLVGGITGVIVASPPLDFQFHDTYYVVAHFHNVIVGGTVYGMFAGFYFWFPKATGRMLSERLGKAHFVLMTAGVTLQLVPQYQLGAEGMPRRYADYPPVAGWEALNLVSTAGAVLQALGMVIFLVAIVRAMRSPATAPDDPWEANSLEWATSSPPPHHNFRTLPPITSERPVFDERLRRARISVPAEPATTGSGGSGDRATSDPPPVAEREDPGHMAG